MDTFTDGGMAPALQSCNHQSTGLANEDGAIHQAESALLHKKVNGKTYAVDSTLDVNPAGSGTKETIDDSTDHNTHVNLSEVSRVSESDSSDLVGLKRVTPEITMPTLQIGQGDSVIGHIADYNGWGDRKKSFIGGILQENNNLSVVKPCITPTKVKKPTSNDCHTHCTPNVPCNGNGENRHSEISPVKHNGHPRNPESVNEQSVNTNGDSFGMEHEASMSCSKANRSEIISGDNDQSGNPCNKSGSDLLGSSPTHSILTEESLDIMLPFSERTCNTSVVKEQSEACVSKDVECEKQHSTKVERNEDCLAELTCASVQGDCKYNPSSHEISSKPLNDQNCLAIQNNQLSLPHQQSAEDTLLSQILPGNLSEMSMSDNLTNTLQELAASLKGASFPLQLGDITSEIVSKESKHTVNINDDNLHKSAKTLNFGSEDYSEQETRISARISHVTHCAGVLEHRLGLLKEKLFQLRSNCVKTHAQNQLTKIAGYLPRQDWESRPVDVMNVDTTPMADLWQKVLDSSHEVVTKSTCENYDTQDLIKTESRDNESAGRRSRSESDRGGPLEVSGIAVNPIVHLTRLESNKTTSKKELRKLMQAKTGVLRKELRYAQSCCDPDLTESSSDEDLAAAYEGRSQKPSKANSKANSKPRITRYRKSFCRWVAERAEISRKWIWLQSRISGMEFDIRHQGDLYNQLRTSKGMVSLVPSATESNPDIQGNAAFGEDTIGGEDADGNQTSRSSPPCSVNHVLDNVNHQASRLIDKLSPVSGGWPSPVQGVTTSETDSFDVDLPSTVPSAVVQNVQPLCTLETCARATPLDQSVFKTRRLVRINQKCLNPNNSLKRVTVPNDSSIMYSEQHCSKLHQNEDYSSLVLKAAVHDHSYHATISSIKDIPLSISVRAVMKSKHKWSKKSAQKKKEKVKKEKRKLKNKSDTKLRRSLHVNHLEESVYSKRRKLVTQLSESSTRKRTSGSMDYDVDSQVIVGGFNIYQSQGSASGTTTPTSEILGSNQIHWKKKKATDQAFDINNIVIPHSLNSTRIEKLVYKEIQTPSWKLLEICSDDEALEGKDQTFEDEIEDTSDSVFQKRHDNYEISEKKKYMAFMQWSISRRGSRCSRMGNMGEPTVQESISPTPLPGEVGSQSRAVDISSNISTSQPISPSPTAKPGVARRLSGDHGLSERCLTPPNTLPQSQRNFDTSFTACPSPFTPICHSDAGSRRNSHENPALSYSTNKTDDTGGDGWEIRSFPLNNEDVMLLNDIEYAKKLLRGSSHMKADNSAYRCFDGEDAARQSSNRAQNFDVKLGTLEIPRDPMRSIIRRRTDSRASSLASFDDSARHSDASSASVSSSRRKKKGFHSTPAPLSNRRSTGGSKGSNKLASSRKPKHEYIHVRLSETDDTSSDSDVDSTDEDSSFMSDDAGHLIDDYADPEWEAPRHRDRR